MAELIAHNRKLKERSVAIPDVQGQADNRNLAIDQVGVKGVRRPIVFDDHGHRHHTIANMDLYVDLDARSKGIHMSRLVELLENHQGEFSIDIFQGFLERMTSLQHSDGARFALRFPLFLEKQAPITKITGLMDYDVTVRGEVRDGGYRLQLRVVVPVTSLCPCSRDISRHGAHNQRSHITLSATIVQSFSIAELIRSLERQGSSELYAILKRADEQFVTEHAYENPKFVEDIVRDVALLMKDYPGLGNFCAEVENFESIHNYSAYACISSEE